MLFKGERFSIECRKTKTKAITTANQKEGKYHKEPIRTRIKGKQTERESDWLIKQGEFSEPIP